MQATGSKEDGYKCSVCGWPVERCEIVSIYEPGVAFYQICLDCLARMGKRKQTEEDEKTWEKIG